jgi:hypothetical protein
MKSDCVEAEVHVTQPWRLHFVVMSFVKLLEAPDWVTIAPTVVSVCGGYC